MEYKDTRNKFTQAWQQEILDEMAKRGMKLKLPSSPEYFYAMSGTFQGQQVQLWLSTHLNTLKVSWGPIYYPKSNASSVSYVTTGSKSYDVLITNLTRKIRKLGKAVFIGQEAVEAMVVNNAAGNTGSFRWHYDRIAEAVKQASPGTVVQQGTLEFAISQDLKDVVEKQDTPGAVALKLKYL